MPHIRWKPAYTTNIPAVDAQHQRLIELFNGFHDAVCVGRDRTILSAGLTELVEHAEMHFAFEEEMLRERDYPDLEHHRTEHLKLIRSIKAEATVFHSGGHPEVLAALARLKEWFESHLATEDKSYSVFLAKQDRCRQQSAGPRSVYTQSGFHEPGHLPIE